MPRKIIIDCDMGIDDAVALCMILFDQRFEVLAVTATEGCVTAEQANNNLQAIISELDPDRYPRLGIARSTEDAPAVNTRYLFGEDGLGNSGFEGTQRQKPLAAEKLIIDCVRAHPEQVTILCLGPLTNIARAFQREPGLADLVDQIVIVGGTIAGNGNITPCAEFNFYFDPVSAKSVLKTRTTKILVPLEVTREVAFGFDMMEALPKSGSRAGYFLRQILPHIFRSYRQQLGLESIHLNDAIGALAVIEPEMFEYELMACDIETEGELTRGVLVSDRRGQREWRLNVNVAKKIKNEQIGQYLLDQLTVAGKHS
ncbi:MAG: nucleoside hydrolase [Planctomycetota bacterium]